jgi:DNA-binding winged helix-turn-helix (wHTH) protein
MPKMSAPTVSPVSGSRFSFGVFTIDLRARKLLRGSDAVPLPARAFDALAYLATNAGQPIDKNEIISAAWRDVAVTDDSLIHAFSVIRKALGDDPEQPSFIETIPRFGYRFVTTVVPLGEHPPAAGQQVLAANGARAAEASTSGKVWREALALGCLMLAVVGLTVWVLGSIIHPPPAMPDGDRVVRLDQLAPAGTTIISGGAVSPTGTHLAFVALDDATGETAVHAAASPPKELT